MFHEARSTREKKRGKCPNAGAGTHFELHKVAQCGGQRTCELRDNTFNPIGFLTFFLLLEEKKKKKTKSLF